jgi:hypothetical protein
MTVKKQQDKTKIVQIWGEILDEGFTSVPNILLRYRSNLGLKPQHLTLIIDIMSFKWDSESHFPSYSALSQRAGVDERSIKRITQDLEELNLLIKTPRFDEETGAQITTIFDFRPLVQRLTEEMHKARSEEGSNITSSIRTHREEDSKLIKSREELKFRGEDEPQFREELTYDSTPTNRTMRKDEPNLTGGGDKFVMGEGDKFVTGGVTNISRGGVTNLSPEEYSYRRSNIYVSTHYTEGGNLKSKERANSDDEDTEIEEDAKERVHTYFRNGIFRKRLFEIYDNLHDIKSIEELVEEGAYKACKEIMVNRAVDLSISKRQINPDQIAEQVKLEFPYRKIPKKHDKARSFFVATVCNLTARKIASFLGK